MSKITIIGAGRVGESTAQFLAERNLCNSIALLDVREGAAEGAALDIQEVAPLFGYDTRVVGGSDPSIMTDSNLIVVTAGLPRKPGMSRSDLLEANINIIDSILNDVMKYAPDTKLLFVTNPVDVVTYYAWKKTGWDRNRIFGQAGVLDSARMAAFIAMETGFSVRDIDTMVLGGHGDSMVPLVRFTTISGVPIERFINDERMEEIIERTRNGGAEILGLRKNSSAYDAPAAAVVEMVDSIVNERHRLLPTVCVLEGEYGHDDIAIGVPAVLGADGIEKIVMLYLTQEEGAMFDHSAELVKQDIKLLKEIRDEIC